MPMSITYIHCQCKPMKVAVSGPPGVGKDTFFQKLVSASGRKGQMVALGDLIKKELSNILLLLREIDSDEIIANTSGLSLADIEQLHKDLSPEEIAIGDAYAKTPGVRKVLQDFGGASTYTKFEPSYWLKLFEEQLKNTSDTNIIYGSTGCRQPKEVDILRSYGFLTIRLLPPSPESCLERLAAREGYVHDKGVLSHPAERALDDYQHWDAVFMNNTWADLDNAVEKTLALF